MLQGGKFGHGFAAAGVSTLGGSLKIGGNTLGAKVLKRAVIGGTVSRITGGKFGNGAATSAFSALVDEAHRAQHKRDVQEFYDSLSDQAGEAGSSDGWTADGVKEILKLTKVGRRFLRQLNKNPVNVIRFETASDTFTNPDGTTEFVDLSRRLKGNYENGNVRLNSRLSDSLAVFTLYHEYQHHLGYGEVDARVLTEQFAIDMGAGPTSPGYRTSGGAPNRELFSQHPSINLSVTKVMLIFMI